MDMKNWSKNLIAEKRKKAMPILSFPSIQLMNIGVRELISDSELQAEGMRLVAERTDALASVSMMDLSLEAEAFGSAIKVSDDEVPTVTGKLIETYEDAKNLKVPDPTVGRPALYIEAIKKAVAKITDRPVLAGVIGPFSLAGRLMDVSEAMIKCYEDPDMVHEAMEKATQFIIKYAEEYKKVGAAGVVIAEPLSGLLSPSLIEEFSTPYVKKLVEAIKTDDFVVVYHNCGNNTVMLLDSILESGADAYHFGNAIDMEDILKKAPSDTVIMGNIDPAGQFRGGTPESMREVTLELMERCAKYDNFVISSGCDIPPMSKWENIDAFFAAVDEFYSK